MNALRSSFLLQTRLGNLKGNLSAFLRKRNQTILAYTLLAPDLIGIMIFVVLPIFMALFMSLTDWSGLKESTFIGLTNYKTMFKDELWRKSIVTTFIYVTVMIPATTIAALGLALFVTSKHFKFRDFFRMTFFSPYMLPLIVVSVTWKFIYDPLGGFLNFVLRTFNFPKLAWLGSVDTALLCIMIVSLWWIAGYYMIIFVAGLNDIPREFLDAAAIDGASKTQTFFHITIPLLKPTLTFVLVILTIDSFQLFDMVYVMTRGGPARSTHVNVLYIYEKAFIHHDMGYASAIAFFLCVIIFLVSIFLLKILRTGRID